MSDLREQDWDAIEKAYFESGPFNYAIIDGLFPDDARREIQSELANGWAWQLMNRDGEELFMRDFGSERIEAIGRQLVSRLPRVFGGASLQQYIAFWHHHNAGLYAHSDISRVSVNLWLTPDEYNLDPATGGMILHDVKRTEDMDIHEFNSAPWSTDYVAAHTNGGTARVPYRCNRAVLFDSRTFHATETPLKFANDRPESIRLNLTLMFDDPEQFRARLGRYHAYAFPGATGQH